MERYTAVSRAAKFNVSLSKFNVNEIFSSRLNVWVSHSMLHQWLYYCHFLFKKMKDIYMSKLLIVCLQQINACESNCRIHVANSFGQQY